MTLTADRPVSTDFAVARKAMIDSQLRPSGVNDDRVLSAMGRTAREDFIPAVARNYAYMDRAIALGGGRFLAAPLVHGRMLVEAEPSSSDNALLVSTGSGYLAELLRPLVGSLEVLDAAAVAARKKKGGFSLLIIDGAIEELPDALAAQLADNGRIVTGLVTRGVTRLAAGRSIAGQVSLLPLAEIGMPILPEFAAPKRWSF